MQAVNYVNVIGISRQKYARIENGVNSITLDVLSKIADVLGVTVNGMIIKRVFYDTNGKIVKEE